MILETKLQPPSLKPNTLKRERLLKLLKNNLERKLVLITGDAGYGKTTLLAQVMKEKDLSSVYYDLDKGDSDLVVFASYLVHGLERIQPGLASRVKGLLEQGGEVGKNYELLFGTLINELVEKRKEELFFILDDYHALPEDSLVHQALDYFIDHLPDIVHVILASRTIPPLPSLSKWRAKQDLYELTKEGLKFTEEEVKALLSEVYKLVLSEEELRRVSEQTEGWITGIQLILQSAGKDGKTVKETLNGYLEAHQPLFEYFANEIYSGESMEVQDFLRKSSILDLLTPEACDSLMGKRDVVELVKEYRGSPASGVSGSERLLKDLEKRNLFVSPVGKGEYKVHRLFREFLESRIPDEKLKTALHLKAADYYQRKGELEQAIEHYLEAGSYEWAGKMIAQVVDTMEDQARFSTLKGWLQQIPEEIYERLPWLWLIRGKWFREKQQFEMAEHSFDRAESLFKRNEDIPGMVGVGFERGSLMWQKELYSEALKVLRRALRICPAQEEKKQAEILNTMGLIYSAQGDLRKAKAAMERAYALMESVKDYPNLIRLGYNLAELEVQGGKLREAFKQYEKLFDRLEGKYQYRAGLLYANASKIALMIGHEGWAERKLKEGGELCKLHEDLWSRAALESGFGALYMDQAQWEQAGHYLQRAREDFANLHLVSSEAMALRDLGRLYRYQGLPEKAKGYLEQSRSLLTGRKVSMEGQYGASLLIEIGLCELALGHLERAAKNIRDSLALLRKINWTLGLFLVGLADAEVLLARGKKGQALRSFRAAVQSAKHNGYDGLFKRELGRSPRLIELARRSLGASSGKDELLAYLRGILDRCGAPIPPREESASLRARLFGVLQVSLSNGKAVPLRWRSRSVASLFAYLLLHRDRGCNREELMDAFWPKASRKQAGLSLRVSASRLKDALAAGLLQTGERALARTPLVLHQEGGYRLAPGLSFQLDVEEFLKEWQDASALEKEGKAEESIAGYRMCLELYRDDFLPNLGERWCEERRKDYKELYLTATRRLAVRSLERGAYEETVIFSRRYLARDPYSEEVRWELWRALKAVGRMADIYKDYKELRQLLRRNLGEEPREETEQVYRSLVSGESPMR